MDAHENLRHLGWSKRQRDDFLADCTEDETEAITKADTGDKLRKVIDDISDRLNADTETDESPDDVSVLPTLRPPFIEQAADAE